MFEMDGASVGLIILVLCALAGSLVGAPVAFAVAGGSVLAFAIVVLLSEAGMLVRTTIDTSSHPYQKLVDQGIPESTISVSRFPELPTIGQSVFPGGWSQASDKLFTQSIEKIDEIVLSGQPVQSFLAVLMLMLMASTLKRFNFVNDLLTSLAAIFGPFPGGLAVSAVVGGIVLAAVTGATGTALAAMAVVSVPAMARNHYSPPFASGITAASGSLGFILPPSILLILLGTLVGEIHPSHALSSATEVGEEFVSRAMANTTLSVEVLFQAALVPGLALAALYAAAAVLYALVRPVQAPSVPNVLSYTERSDVADRLVWLVGVPAILLAILAAIAFFGLLDGRIRTGTAASVLSLAILISIGWGVARNSNPIPFVIGGAGVAAALAVDYSFASARTPLWMGVVYFAVPAAAAIFGSWSAALALSRYETIRSLFPPLALIGVVLGTVLGGVLTVSSAAAMGAAGALMLAAYKSLRSSGRSGKAVVAAVISVFVLILVGNAFDIRVGRSPAGFDDWLATAISHGAYTIAMIGFLYSVCVLYFFKELLPILLETAAEVSTLFVAMIASLVLYHVVRSFGGTELVADFFNAFERDWIAFLIFLVVLLAMGPLLGAYMSIFIAIPIAGPAIFYGDLDPIWITVMIAMVLCTSSLIPPFVTSMKIFRKNLAWCFPSSQACVSVHPIVAIHMVFLVLLWLFPAVATFFPDLLAG